MKKSCISVFKQRKLIELFITETTAEIASKIIGIHRKSAAYYFYRLKRLIFENTNEKRLQFLEGEIELDERCFGGKRKGKRGCGAAEKIPVLGILKRKGKVYAEMIKNTKSTSLMPIVKQKNMPSKHCIHRYLSVLQLINS